MVTKKPTAASNLAGAKAMYGSSANVKPKYTYVKPAGVSGSADTMERQIAAQQAAAAPAPAPEPVSFPQVANGPDQVGYGTATVDNPVPATPDTSVETLTKTPEYMARERALAAAMELFGQSQATERARYGKSYDESLQELGYDPTNARFDLGELMSSGQRATTSGKAYNALRNDFAARGMLQSGAYQAQRGVLDAQLQQQRKAIDEAKVNFEVDQQAKLAAQNAANEQARQVALQEAKQAILDRYAMGA